MECPLKGLTVRLVEEPVPVSSGNTEESNTVPRILEV